MRLEDEEISNIVRACVLEHKWSPEQTSNRIALERQDLRTSTTTVYRAIYRHLLDCSPYQHGKGLRNSSDTMESGVTSATMRRSEAR